jgi:uncharacterized damage-inducible protein DinB
MTAVAAATEETYMNIPEVQGIAKTFQTVSEVLKGVSTAIGVLIQVIRSTAFIGNVGAFAEAQFLEQVKKQLDQLSQRCQELSQEVLTSVQAYERGDAQGATKFY